jgi:hypothetical protein
MTVTIIGITTGIMDRSMIKIAIGIIHIGVLIATASGITTEDIGTTGITGTSL